MSGAKLRTDRLREPAKSATVYIAEKIGALWFPVIETHKGCHGMTHERCEVTARAVADQGFALQSDALTALREHAERPRA